MASITGQGINKADLFFHEQTVLHKIQFRGASLRPLNEIYPVSWRSYMTKESGQKKWTDKEEDSYKVFFSVCLYGDVTTVYVLNPYSAEFLKIY